MSLLTESSCTAVLVLGYGGGPFIPGSCALRKFARESNPSGLMIWLPGGVEDSLPL